MLARYFCNTSNDILSLLFKILDGDLILICGKKEERIPDYLTTTRRKTGQNSDGIFYLLVVIYIRIQIFHDMKNIF